MRRDLFAWTVLALLGTALCAGCSGVPAPLATPGEPAIGLPQRGGTAEPTATVDQEPEREVTVTTTPTPTPGAAQPGLSADVQAVADRAREDLAQRTGLGLAAIQLVSVESVEWRDASLGCPQPGRMYAQVITPGFRVVLKAAGQVYTYHTDRQEHVILCADGPVPDEPLPTAPVDPDLKELANQAREDLAGRLSVPVDSIEVVDAQSVVWPDGSLGCPEPGMAYTQVQVEGVLIVLRAGERTFYYHGGGGTAPFWCRRSTQDTSTRD